MEAIERRADDDELAQLALLGCHDPAQAAIERVADHSHAAAGHLRPELVAT